MTPTIILSIRHIFVELLGLLEQTQLTKLLGLFDEASDFRDKTASGERHAEIRASTATLLAARLECISQASIIVFTASRAMAWSKRP